ncbi:MAG: universal stress protein [Flavobacteriales bacterium]|nr:universal stress protein [Flavobacteriia bacterium]NCP06695.1 universal stress protein [Flavobacteriales bacterium]PIV92435.1 MAG: universal stress protein [Flavobacteriaceae bacterium CG17_big_fil_post_rev_8_21_14_2_50_33_15]PIY12460.1 MAG: universal stress protein [Flavobacteriaceae bacterium CG_4_10_14_3_um_filter_33_47]PJB18031.1 MAG: universal stress protein [Flavobacteriaceae bacterium CG_4_9_14_3_um_filter_33_16]
MKNILIPTDFSKNSCNAIEYALKFYEKSNCNFYLLHVNTINTLVVAETTYMPTQEVIDEAFVKPAKVKLKELLKKLVSVSNNEKHQFYTLTDYNYFIDSIRKHVSEKKINVIVMGTKGASGLKKLIVGSNTGDVITRVHCTTLVVPENAKYQTPKEIAFPTDFSSFYSLELLKPIMEVLDLYKGTVNILHINKKGASLNLDQQINKGYLEDYFVNSHCVFHNLTNNHIESAIQSFVEKKNVNLITMVAKNLNYFQRILFHPTVQEISYHTDIPFLVLHE